MRLSRSKSISWFSRWTLTPTLMREDPLAVRHSLVRLLAVADRNSLDVHRAVALYSQEHWGLRRWGLQGLLQSLKTEQTLVQALEKNPSCLGDSAMLALRLGDASGTWQAAWAELTLWERPIHTEAAKLWQGSKAYWTIVAMVLTLVSLFIVKLVGPVFLRMNQEFSRDYNFENYEEFLLLWQGMNTLVQATLVGLPLLACFWLVWRAITWHPRSWLRCFTARGRVERAMRQAGLGRLVAMNLASGVSANKTIELLASLHDNARTQKRLSRAVDSLSTGNSAWQSLVNVKLLHPVEHDAVVATDNPEVQAWTLRHLALRRRENLHFGALRRNIWIQPIVTLLFGLFVFAIAYFMFTSLTQMVLLIAERHG